VPPNTGRPARKNPTQRVQPGSTELLWVAVHDGMPAE
jgi:hypothetical protein